MKWIKDSMLFHVFLLLVAVAVAYGSFRMAGQAIGVYHESLANRKKIEELTRKKQELEHYLEQLQTPGAVERQAKERLNLKLPGEEVVVVVAEQASSTQKSAVRAGKGIWNWLAGLWRAAP